MIDDYLEEKEVKKQYETLLAWRHFYVECSNDWETLKINRKIERFELNNFE